jgi:hypothetical protein
MTRRWFDGKPFYCVTCGEEYVSCGATGDIEIQDAGCKLESESVAQLRAQRCRPITSDLAKAKAQQGE